MNKLLAILIVRYAFNIDIFLSKRLLEKWLAQNPEFSTGEKRTIHNFMTPQELGTFIYVNWSDEQNYE